MCCSLEEEEEKGPLRTAYTVSETVISQVSTSSNGLGEPALEPSAPEMEANSRNGTRDRLKKTRSMSYSKQLEAAPPTLNGTGGYCNGHRSQSCEVLQDPEQTITVATLHTRPPGPRPTQAPATFSMAPGPPPSQAPGPTKALSPRPAQALATYTLAPGGARGARTRSGLLVTHL